MPLNMMPELVCAENWGGRPPGVRSYACGHLLDPETQPEGASALECRLCGGKHIGNDLSVADSLPDERLAWKNAECLMAKRIAVRHGRVVRIIPQRPAASNCTL